MYTLHPATVHLPLGLLLASGLFTLIYLRRGDAAWETSAYHCLLVGWLAGALAVLSGSLDALRQLTGPDGARDNNVIGWVNAHAFANIAALALYGQALLRRRRRPDLLVDAEARRGYLWLQLGGAALLLFGGWAGGHLVYGLGLGIGR